MGGHGALMIALRNPHAMPACRLFTHRRTVTSAFGTKAFSACWAMAKTPGQTTISLALMETVGAWQKLPY